MTKSENFFSLLQNGKNAGLFNLHGQAITTSLEAVKENSEPAAAAEADKIGLPKKFSMPLFGIDAEIQEVGLTPGGEMEAPDNYKSVGWFKFGIKPGENGNAVLAGHLDTNLGKKGVFWNLNKLKRGDYVYVTDEFDKKMRFRVTRSEIYDAENAPMEEIFGPSGAPHLNLVTCDGVWDKLKKNYNKRLVVFTDYDPE